MNLTTDTPIEALAREYLDAKAVEDAAIARRREIGALIESCVQGDPESTATLDAGGLKISVQRKVTRSIDQDALRLRWETLPGPVQDAFRWKAEVDLKGLRNLETGKGFDAYAVAAQFITTKPAAATIKITEAK